jgi:hypothetical protein
MPKKTKKEKLLAEKHRRPSLPPIVVTATPHAPTHVIADTTFRLPNITKSAPATATYSSSESIAIRHDLTKSILLISAIIAVEFILSRYLH